LDLGHFVCRNASSAGHIFTDGHRRGSPTLLTEHPDEDKTHEDFCYYHPPPSASYSSQSPAQTSFDLPLPEDRSSIQAAIGQVLQHIAANTLGPRRARLLLHGLQIASLNLPPQPRPSCEDDASSTVTAIVTHPTLGPIAAAAELTRPPEHRSIGRNLLDELEELDRIHEPQPETETTALNSEPAIPPPLDATADRTTKRRVPHPSAQSHRAEGWEGTPSATGNPGCPMSRP